MCHRPSFLYLKQPHHQDINADSPISVFKIFLSDAALYTEDEMLCTLLFVFLRMAGAVGNESEVPPLQQQQQQ